MKEAAIAKVESGVSTLRNFAAVKEHARDGADDDGDGANRRGEEEPAPDGQSRAGTIQGRQDQEHSGHQKEMPHFTGSGFEVRRMQPAKHRQSGPTEPQPTDSRQIERRSILSHA